MTKEEMEKKLQNMENLEKAIEEKDNKIAKLTQEFEKNVQEKVSEITNKLTKENKDLKESLANIQNAFQIRIKQLEELLLTHGDLLKSLESLTNSHLKINKFMVDGINGGN